MTNSKELTNKTKPNKKEHKTMKKINWETVKTVLIAILLTGIAAFMGGMHYQQSQSERIKQEAVSIVQEIKPKTDTKSKQ